MGEGIYIASKTRHAEKWKTLRAAGVPIISTWIDEAGCGDTTDFSDLWQRCIREASSCALLIFYAEGFDILKGGFIEVGAALASGADVYTVLVGGSAYENESFLYHPNVHQASSIETVMLRRPEVFVRRPEVFVSST